MSYSSPFYSAYAASVYPHSLPAQSARTIYPHSLPTGGNRWSWEVKRQSYPNVRDLWSIWNINLIISNWYVSSCSYFSIPWNWNSGLNVLRTGPQPNRFEFLVPWIPRDCIGIVHRFPANCSRSSIILKNNFAACSLVYSHVTPQCVVSIIPTVVSRGPDQVLRLSLLRKSFDCRRQSLIFCLLFSLCTLLTARLAIYFLLWPVI